MATHSSVLAKVGSQETPRVTGKFGLGIRNEAGQTNRVLSIQTEGNDFVTEALTIYKFIMIIRSTYVIPEQLGSDGLPSVLQNDVEGGKKYRLLGPWSL